jgi:cytochrome b subunit of formate dehydrogenase
MHNDPNSPVSAGNVSAKVCTPCHSSVKLTSKYGLSANRPETFQDSYHGLAIEGGSTTVANCASCHSAHDIKPASDPTSTVYKGNLIKTCGKCHPGANKNFTVGQVHLTMTKKAEPILYWIANAYLLLIFIVIGGMLLHNILDFIKKAKIKKMKQRGLIKEEHHGHALYLRMNLSERIQHIALLSSFLTLVVTGFMLRFPETWWVSHLRNLSEYGFEIRGIIHRVAAVVMVAASLYHLYYILFTTRGKQLVKDLLPRYSDITEAIGVAKYNLGISKTKPKLDRFSYVEKAEYWALIWGTIVMTITGVILWFDNTFIGLLTKLGWDIARTIHFYEAWLAFLAIVVWHFYFVIFNPDAYPMNIAWLKGTITEEEMAEEHPAELERIKKQNQESQENQDNKEQ